MQELLQSSGIYRPEDNPFQTLAIDVTHRCNMKCNNCYLPNREIPDMDKEWLYDILKRLPRRTRIRIVGAEPTMRNDLPELIKNIRKLRHLPILMTNGLKLANISYLRNLKASGLRSVYLSFNGGFDDQAYLAIDDLSCVKQKTKALENLISENMYIAIGMIVVRSVNEKQVKKVFDYAKVSRQIYELHLRGVAPYGRYMNTEQYTMKEIEQLFNQVLEDSSEKNFILNQGHNCVEFNTLGLKVKITHWPDLGSNKRGRLSPDGTIHRFFEHMIANEGGY